MYVFDRGYVDYETFDRMTDEGYFFVSRLKKNESFEKFKPFQVPEGMPVSNPTKMVYIGSNQNRTENVFRLH